MSLRTHFFIQTTTLLHTSSWCYYDLQYIQYWCQQEEFSLLVACAKNFLITLHKISETDLQDYQYDPSLWLITTDVYDHVFLGNSSIEIFRTMSFSTVDVYSSRTFKKAITPLTSVPVDKIQPCWCRSRKTTRPTSPRKRKATKF